MRMMAGMVMAAVLVAGGAFCEGLETGIELERPLFELPSDTKPEESGNAAQGGGAAVSELEAKAEAGDAEAQCRLGIAWLRGDGREKNYISAVRLLRKAAEAGSSEAQIELGMMYYAGKGVYKDSISAYVFLSLASSTIMVAPPDVWTDARHALGALDTSLSPEAKGIAAERLDVEREKILAGAMRRHP